MRHLTQLEVYDEWSRVHPRDGNPLLSGWRLCATAAGAPVANPSVSVDHPLGVRPDHLLGGRAGGWGGSGATETSGHAQATPGKVELAHERRDLCFRLVALSPFYFRRRRC